MDDLAQDTESRLSEVMATQVASLFGVLRMDDSDFRSSAKNARDEMTGLGDQMKQIGGNVTSLGTNLTALTAPAAAAFGVATKQAVDFNASITNIGAVLGLTSDQMSDLNSQLLEIGGNRRAGPQAVADAFYDIVGGVADASTHMAILNAALDTAEAGGANLKATTSGLISVMNSYGYAADKASYVSDTFTRVVSVGVGTMDDFVAALGPVAGLAAQTGISFTELGTSTAFLTTKGFSASQASTRLQAAITALIKPNDAMTKALKAAGIESGSMALKQYGLVGTLQKVSDAVGGSTDAMAAALGTTEALGATTALLGNDFKGFSDNFTAGLNGATAAAQGIQNLSDQAKLDLLNSQMSELAISAGGALVPALLQVVDAVKPIISNVIDWVNQNPELVAQIGMIVAGLAVAGPILIGVGAAIGAIGGILGFILSPIGLIIIGIAAIAAAFATNFGGIQDQLLPFKLRIEALVNDFIQNVWNPAVTALQQIWAIVQPELQKLWDWFINTGLPAIRDFIVNEVVPKVQDFINLLSGIWDTVSPVLGDLFNWFITEGLPKIVSALSDFKTNAVDPVINLLSTIWDAVSPALQKVYDWFLKDGLPGIRDALKWVSDNVIKPAVDLITSLIDAAGKVVGTVSNAINSALGGNSTGGTFQNTGSSALYAYANNLPSSFGNYNLGTHDYLGPYAANQPLMVGTGAQPEAFIPTSSGMAIPNFDQFMQQRSGGGGGDTYHVTINAGAGANGTQIANDFETRLRELRRQRG